MSKDAIGDVNHLRNCATCDAINTFTGVHRFLSNFYPSPSTPPTLEHHFQAAKLADPGARLIVLSASTPGEAKRLGRVHRMRDDWDSVKTTVMRELVRAKFSNPALRVLLLATGDAALREGNHWHDNYWGHCDCNRCIDVPHHNMLGKILMEVRATLNVK